MKFAALIAKVGTPTSWRESIASIRTAQGKGASRWLAERFGVSQRTAQRWLKGEQAPSEASGRREAVRKAAAPREVAAAKLRGAQVIAVGKVKVRYGVRDEGMRNVGTLRVDAELRAELGRVAAMVERGDTAGAERAMSTAILGAYSGQRARDGRNVVQGTLDIDDYKDGIVIA